MIYVTAESCSLSKHVETELFPQMDRLVSVLLLELSDRPLVSLKSTYVLAIRQRA